MSKIGILKNRILEYAWGSYTAIPELLGTGSPSNNPQAELWIGAHPKAPSMVKYSDSRVSLLELIGKNPKGILGEKVTARFGNRLPYLFKVLAAAEPLSLQAHPSLIQARKGFERENDQGIPLNAPNRSYKDANHKPECICALTPFWALNGFRKISGILSYMEKLLSRELESELQDLRLHPDSQGFERFFHALIKIENERKKHIIDRAVSKTEKYSGDDPVFKWIRLLHDVYPSDMGILSPVLLNLICLEPGQAMFLPSGELHAYLDGVGIELMANSDNVLRGGLTEKYIDVPELMNVLNFEERKVEILSPRKENDYEFVYDSQAEEFLLSVLSLKKDTTYCSRADRSIEILLCIDGKAGIRELDGTGELAVSKGVSVLIPASVGKYDITGEALEDTVLYKASVPI